jgi:hypothetical protein
MSEFRILVFEDDVPWKESFEYSLRPQIEIEGIRFLLRHRENDNTLMEDLEWLPDLIMIDYDLGELAGEEIIEAINNDAAYHKSSIYYYSGGETIDHLKAIAKKYKCNIQCFTKEGNSIEESILSLIPKKA